MTLFNRKRVLLGVVILAILVVAGILLIPALRRHAATEYKTSISPDGKYKVVVYRLPDFWSRMPGQAGDAPGYIRLYDRAGHVLAETDVEMVQIADRISWEKNKVNIWLVADWNLPE